MDQDELLIRRSEGAYQYPTINCHLFIRLGAFPFMPVCTLRFVRLDSIAEERLGSDADKGIIFRGFA